MALSDGATEECEVSANKSFIAGVTKSALKLNKSDIVPLITLKMCIVWILSKGEVYGMGIIYQ